MQQQQTSAVYRPEIDGLRALAVLLVIAHHLQITQVSGGFVGVDVFFVISGYLITGIIWRELSSTGHLQTRNFYLRRILRLMPSMLVMLVGAMIAAALMFSLDDMTHFATATMSSLLSVANGYYYVTTDYFTQTDTKPLLHTWSLSVEEQFYLIWPFILIAFYRCGARSMRLRVMFFLLALMSLGLAIGGSYVDAQAAFYLLPARAYEFMAGAALAIWPLSVHRRWADLCLLAGIGSIVAAATLFSTHTPFPSYYALLPCVGAMAIIASGQQARMAVVLSNPVCSYLGRISYQLYLFHWPVIIFAKYLTFSALTTLDTMVVLVATLLLSMATYHWVDIPCRRAREADAARRNTILLAMALTAAALSLLVFTAKRDGGWPWRLPESTRLFIQNPGEFHKTNFGGAGYTDNKAIHLGDPLTKPSFILFGDSFAAQYAYGLNQFLKKHRRAATAFMLNGCMFAPEITIHWSGQAPRECSLAFNRVLALLKDNTLPVIYAQSWTTYKEALMSKKGDMLTFDKSNNNDYYRYMIHTIESVRRAIGDRTLFVMGVSPGIHDQKAVARCSRMPNILPNQCASTVKFNENELWNGLEFNAAATEYAAQHPRVIFLNPREAICKDGWCHAIENGKSYYSDVSHFSKEGSRIVIEYFGSTLLNLAENPAGQLSSGQ